MKFVLILLISLGNTAMSGTDPASALPPPEDTPEEVLRTEIIVEARSPVDGESLTPAEYAELQGELQESENPPEVAASLQDQIFLLKLLNLLDLVNPF
jgi:hypothetical protein